MLKWDDMNEEVEDSRESQRKCVWRLNAPNAPFFARESCSRHFSSIQNLSWHISEAKQNTAVSSCQTKCCCVFSVRFDFYIILWWDYGTFSGIFFFHSSSDFGVCWKDHMASCTKCFIDDIILTRLTEVPSRSWSVEKKSLTSGWENRKKKIVNVFSLPCDFDMNKKKTKSWNHNREIERRERWRNKKIVEFVCLRGYIEKVVNEKKGEGIGEVITA